MTPHTARRRLPWLFAPPIAHRGLHDAAGGVPENSRAAFATAVEAGYGVELDVQPSAEGEAMVFHDDALARMTGAAGRVWERRASELAALRLAGDGETMPSLAETLAVVAGRVPLFVEIKYRGGRAIGRLEARVAALLAGYGGPVAVQSFEPRLLAWFADHAPDLPRGQISGDYRRYREAPLSFAARWRRTMLGYTALARPDYIVYEWRALPNPATRAARREGLPVLAWTVQSPAEYDHARRHADNVLFEGFRP
jgi:glycerophosphoryl diester phosphodiesterase